MNAVQICGAVSVMILIVVVGLWSGRKVRDAADFESGGGRAGFGVVSGMIMGGLVGGASTIGTAQLAYTDGLLAWWATLGSGLGCLLMAFVLSRPYRALKSPTLIGVLRQEYGKWVDLAVSVMIILSGLLGVIAQLLAATAIIPYIFPNLTEGTSVILAAFLVLAYVGFGGALGAGAVGRIKTILLCGAILGGMCIIFQKGGIVPLKGSLDYATYFDLFSKPGEGIGKAAAMVLNVITSQFYMQAVCMGRTEKIARNSMVTSAVMTPLLGLGGTLIGMFMRAGGPVLESSKNALPQFALTYLPEWLSGVVIGALLLTIVGTGAASTLVVGVTISEDVMQVLTKKKKNPQELLHFMRLSVAVFLVICVLLSVGNLGDFVLTFTVLASAVRGTAILVPLICALLFPGRIRRKWVLTSVISGPAAVMVCYFLNVDGTLVGIAVSALCCAFGAVPQKRLGKRTQSRC